MTDQERIAKLEARVDNLESWIKNKAGPAIKQLQERNKAQNQRLQELEGKKGAAHDLMDFMTNFKKGK